MTLLHVVTSPQRRAELEVDGRWNDDTLIDRVLRYAAEHGDRVAVVDLEGERTSTYAQLADDTRRAAAALAARGVRAGDVVSVQLPNWYETVVIDLAILCLGAVVNPMLPIYRARELRHMLTVGAVRVLVTPRTYRRFDHEGLARQLTRETALEHVLVIDDPHDDPAAFRRWLDAAPPTESTPQRDASRVSELIFTSGTEAAPKAIMHTEQTTGFGVRAAAAALAIGEEDVVWTPSPIGHSTGLNFGVRLGLHHGIPVVLQDAWSPVIAAALIERFRCSYTVAATTFVSDLVEHADTHACDISSMRSFGSGGAPVPPEAVHGAARHAANVLRMYGSTEVLAATWNRHASSLEARLNTDGLPLDGVELEIRGDDGSVLIEEPGEIFVRSPSAAVGFFNDPERTAATFDASGWVRSGDLGVVGRDGHLTIVGRKKEIIIRGGLNIAPREIEDVLVKHQDVQEAAIVGMPDPRLGERACACIVPRPGCTPGLESIVGYLRDQGVAAYKLPERLVLVESLPKTPTGKVRKQELVAALT